MTTIRPGVLSPPGSRPGSADSDLATVAAETSILTHGKALQWLGFTSVFLPRDLSHPAALPSHHHRSKLVCVA